MRAGMRVFGASLLSLAVFHAAAPALALELTDKVKTWLTASEAEKKELTMRYARSFPESRGKGKGAVEIVAMVPEVCLNQYVGPKSTLAKAASRLCWK